MDHAHGIWPVDWLRATQPTHRVREMGSVNSRVLNAQLASKYLLGCPVIATTTFLTYTFLISIFHKQAY